MKKLLILLFVLPFLFACTDTSSSPSEEKKAEKPAPEKTDPPAVCTSDNDCSPGMECKNGTCVIKEQKPGCESNADCPDDKECRHGECVDKEKFANGVACEDSSQCKSGFCNSDHQCSDPDRCANVTCSEGQHCENGYCVADAEHVIRCGDHIKEGNEICDGEPGCNSTCSGYEN